MFLENPDFDSQFIGLLLRSQVLETFVGFHALSFVREFDQAR